MQINLLSPSTTLEIQKKLDYERRNPIKPLLGLSIVVIVLGYGTLYFLAGNAERDLVATKTQIKALQKVKLEQQQELTLIKQLGEKQRKLKEIDEAKIAWQGYLVPLKASMPTSVKLTTLKLEAGGEAVEVEGTSPNSAAVAQFAAKLQATEPYNSNLLVVKTEKVENKEQYTFSITATTSKVSLQEVKTND